MQIDPDLSLVLYDGTCGFCHAVVRFVLKRDRRDRFVFAPLQSRLAREIVGRHGHDPDDVSSVFLVDRPGTPEESVTLRGRAGVEILRRLGGIWSLAGVLRFLPQAVLDGGYRLIARHRKKLLGERGACDLPVPEQRRKFLGDDVR